MIGETVSHYRITKQLGMGGMGVVYEAVDTNLDRTVALKFLPLEATRDPEAKARFIHEAKAASSLDHPNVCTVHEIGEADDGRMFLVMACYQGETLKERIARGPLPLDEAMSITRQVAEGLAVAHDKGIVHRDIKPANIFITDSGLVKILDFGVAKLSGQTQLTRAGTTLGTANYMSPEQARGDATDRRSDLWCLGVVLYEMVSGTVPFRGDYPHAVIYGILNEEPKPVTGLRTGVPLELERVVGKCLAKDAGQRYHHADDLLADLRRMGASSAHLPSAAASRRRPGRARMTDVYVVVTVALFVVTAIFVVAHFHSAASINTRKSIAVLPFRNIVAQPGYEWFGDGMTEAIIGHLAKIDDLKVTSSTSVQQFKDSHQDIKEIAAELGVATVLEGTVQQAGGRIHLVVKLIDARSDEHIWVEEYDREMVDVFALQADVALKIVVQLRLALSSEVEARIEAKPTADLEAYKLLMKGRMLWDQGTNADRLAAIEIYKQVVTLDPQFADAHAVLASAYEWIPVYGYQAPALSHAKAREHAQMALAIDQGNAVANRVLAQLTATDQWDLARSNQLFVRAIELCPGGATLHLNYAWNLMQMGRFDEAVAQFKRGLELSPLNVGNHQNEGELLYYARRYEESIAASRRAIAMNPNYPQSHMFLGLACHELGWDDEARAAIEKELVLSDGSKPEVENWIGIALATLGDRERAQQYLAQLLDRRAKGWASPFIIATHLIALGDLDRGFEFLQKAYDEHDSRLLYLGVHQTYDPVKSDRRYLEMLARIGLTS